MERVCSPGVNLRSQQFLKILNQRHVVEKTSTSLPIHQEI